MQLQHQDLTVPNETASLEQVRSFVQTFLKDSPFSEKERRLLVLAIDETVTSNLLFSQATARLGDTHIALELTEECFRVRVVDTGRDVDPDTEEGFEKHVATARQHEVGIFLVQQIMDEIQYTFRKGFKNELVLVRFLYPKEEA